MATMRKLGSTGIDIAPVVLGTNVFGWTVDEKGSFAILDAFLEAGFNCLDTADAYSRWVPGNQGGESETIIGNWMKARGNRDRVVLVTKVGSDMGLGRKSLASSYILGAAEASLRRLQTDWIDVYLSHWEDETSPAEDTLAAYGALIKSGKVRVIGASNHAPATLRHALEVSRKNGLPAYQIVEPQYNLCERPSFEGELQDLCIERGLGVIPYYALASGFLSGKYRSARDSQGRARGGAVGKYMNERGFRILDAVEAVAAEHRTKPASIALAWLQAQPGVTAPIASATNLSQLKELTNSASIALSNGDLARLNAASA